MSICSDTLSLFEGVLDTFESKSNSNNFAARKTGMIKDANGDIQRVIMRRDEGSEADYDIENPHQTVQKNRNVRRIDPEALDFLNRDQKQEAVLDERAKPKDVADADGTVTHYSYGVPIARRTKDGRVQLNKDKYKYSTTTANHRNKFLGHNSAEMERRIKRGEYDVVNFDEAVSCGDPRHHNFGPNYRGWRWPSDLRCHNKYYSNNTQAYGDRANHRFTDRSDDENRNLFKSVMKHNVKSLTSSNRPSAMSVKEFNQLKARRKANTGKQGD
jgi:hypothetical protein